MIKTALAFGLAALALVGLWLLPLPYFKIFIWVMIGLGLLEFGGMAFSAVADRIFTILLGLALGALMIWGRSFWQLSGWVAGIFLLFLWGMFRKELFPDAVKRMGIIWLGVCYFAMTLPFWCRIRELGAEWLMLLMIPASLTDTFAFLVGKGLGRHKITAISPNKTLEGFVGGVAGGLFGIWLANRLFFVDPLSWSFLLPAGLAISLLVILGDLAESLLKRGFGTKDSSHVFRGHGGVMDRLDALIFVAPLFYAWMAWKGLQ